MNTILLNILTKIELWCKNKKEEIIISSLPKGESAQQWARKRGMANE